MKLSNENKLSVNRCIIQNKTRRTDRIDARSRAGVTAGWAAGSGRGFIGCVIDGITGRITATLERVEQADPMTDFMSENLTQIILICCASREYGIAQDDAVIRRITSIP